MIINVLNLLNLFIHFIQLYFFGVFFVFTVLNLWLLQASVNPSSKTKIRHASQSRAETSVTPVQ